jgi:DNA excision repair protein ERCC-6-like 2
LELEANEEDEGDPLASFGSSEGGREDAAMSQLASEIIDASAGKRQAAAATAKRKDPVAAILASVGVEYTHENAEVIGTSKIETRISSRAQKAGNDIDFDQDRAFGRASQAVPAASADVEGPPLPNDDAGDEVDTICYRYRPSEAIRKRLFCSMARRHGYEDITEFALVVEGWTQEQRREFLDRFYDERRRELV